MDIKEPIKFNKEQQETELKSEQSFVFNLSKTLPRDSFIRIMADDLSKARKKFPGVSSNEMVRESILPPKPLATESIKESIKKPVALPPEKLPIIDSNKETGPVSWFDNLLQSFTQIFNREQKPAKTEKPTPGSVPELFAVHKKEEEELKAELTELTELTELKKPSPPSLPSENNLKFAAIILGIIIIIGSAGGFFYWWNYLRPISPPVVALTHFECQNSQCTEIEGAGQNQCQSDQECQPIQPIIPEPLIAVESTEIVNPEIDKIIALANQEQARSSFKRLLIESADVNEINNILGLNLPEEILGASANYTLFLYNQEQGNRLGLVIDLSPDIEIKPLLEQWENTILIASDKPFLLKEESLLSAQQAFQDNNYQNIAIRYFNFPNPDLSVDYAIINNYLIITTSQNSMYATIERLLNVFP